MAVTPNENIIYREEKGPLDNEAYNLTPQEVDGNFKLLLDKLNGFFSPIEENQFGTHPAASTLMGALQYLYQNGGSAIPVLTYSINAEGDSLTAPLDRNGFSPTWLEKLAQAVSGQKQYINFNNYAVGGAVVGTEQGILNHEGSEMMLIAERNEVLTGKSNTAAANFLFLLASINDLQLGTTTQEAYNRLKGLHNIYVNQGYRTAAFTITTSRHPDTPEHTEFWTRVQSLNNLIQQGWRIDFKATVLLDIQTDPVLGGYDAPLNTTYFRDLIHYTEAGADRIGSNFAVRALPFLVTNTPKVINFDSESDPVFVSGYIPGYTEIHFNSDNDYIIESNGTVKATNAAAAYGFTGKSVYKIPAGQSGRLVMQKRAELGRAGNAVLSFMSTPDEKIFQNTQAGIYLSPSDDTANDVLEGHVNHFDSMGPFPVPPTATILNYQYCALYRAAATGTVTLETSENGAVWLNSHTFGFNSKEDIFFGIDCYGLNGLAYFVQGIGVVPI